MFDTDPHELPREAYERELNAMERALEERLRMAAARQPLARSWCDACGTIGNPGFHGGGERMLCEACEQERLAEVALSLTADELAGIPGA